MKAALKTLAVLCLLLSASFPSAASAALFLYAGPSNTNIDSDPATNTDLVISDAGTLADLNVAISLTGGFLGDMTVSLQHVNTGTTVTLYPTDGGAGTRGGSLNVLFDDAAGGPLPTGDNISGTFQPFAPLAAFNSESITGTWRLITEDTTGFAGEENILVSWFVSGNTTAAQPSLPAGQWNSETFRRAGNASIGNLADADDAINNGVLQGSGLVNSVNYLNSGGDGNFGGGINPLGIPLDIDDFAVKSTGFLQIGEDGSYQFRNNTDDGSRLRIDLNGDGMFGPGEDIIIDDVLAPPHNADSAILNLLAGQYMIEHIWFEAGGGAAGEMGISRDGGFFLLLGNPQNDGFGAYFSYDAYVTAARIIPEPATATLGLMALAGLMLRRRRMA